MKRNILFLALSFCTLILFSSCGDDNDPVELTQAMVDEANQLVASLTGPQNGMDFHHGGPNVGGDATIREIYTNNGSVPSEIEKGYVITKRTYAKNEDGTKGDLLVTFAMLKHEEGYWSDSNDWEYVNMPNNDPSVDFTTNPNGVLSNAMVRGNMFDENPGCVGCHNAAQGGDQLFSND